MDTTGMLKTTCPRDCYDGCGIAVEYAPDGAIRRVLGDRDHPVSRGALCGKCALAYNGVWRDREARLTSPLRRCGPKGGGHFEAIGWERALQAVADRFGRIVAEYGARTILHSHYTGTCSVLAGDFPCRFFNRLGATEVAPDTICNNAGHAALDYVYGTSTTGFDPRTIRDSACVVVWGANPSASAPHADKHWLREHRAEVVVIDPVCHATARRADHHLQLRPGSDALLAYALLHVILREGLQDEAFLAAHTVGWTRLREEVKKVSLADAAAATGVSAAAIETVARRYARGPSLLWLGQGLQRQPAGGNVMRACALLPAVTGNIGRPGAGVCYLNGAGPRHIDADYVTAPHLAPDPPPPVSHPRLAGVLSDPARSRALVNWNMNVAASGPRQRALRAALAREDLFTVVIDLFQTDTADYADIVLPAASFLEFDDLVVPYFHLYLSAQAKAEDPPGEALPNQAIFRRLAAAMGYREPELFEPDRAVIDHLLAGSACDLDFEELKAAGSVELWEEPVIAFADGRYPTPSGRIELVSARAAADGLPPLPLARADAPPAPGEFRLLSPAGEWQMNDSYGNDPTIRRTLGDAEVCMHPDDARRNGLAAGDRVALSNAHGRLVLRLRVGDDIGAGTLLTHKGRWPKHEAEQANVNVLTPPLESDMGQSTCVHGTMVRVERLPG